MKIEFEVDDANLGTLLQLFIAAKTEPDERHLLLGNPLFESLVEKVIEKYILLEGEQAYTQKFLRGGFSQEVGQFIIGCVASNSDETTSDKEIESRISTAVQPIVLTEIAMKRIVMKVRSEITSGK